jgi:hypothetical protein
LRKIAPVGAVVLDDELEETGRANVASYLAAAAGLKRKGGS